MCACCGADVDTKVPHGCAAYARNRCRAIGWCSFDPNSRSSFTLQRHDQYRAGFETKRRSAKPLPPHHSVHIYLNAHTDYYSVILTLMPVRVVPGTSALFQISLGRVCRCSSPLSLPEMMGPLLMVVQTKAGSSTLLCTYRHPVTCWGAKLGRARCTSVLVRSN